MRSLLIAILTTAVWLSLPAVLVAAVDAGAAADADVVEPPAEQATSAEDDADLESQVAEILGRDIDDDADAEGQRCLSRNHYRSVEVLDSQTLAFIGRGDRVWLNQLPAPCHGLNDRLRLELQGSGLRFCRLDGFYGIDTAMLGLGGRTFSDPGGLHSAQAAQARRTPRCLLGDFEPITRDQLNLLREALDTSSPRTAEDS